MSWLHTNNRLPCGRRKVTCQADGQVIVVVSDIDSGADLTIILL